MNISFLPSTYTQKSVPDKMVGWHHQCNGHEIEQAPGDGEGQGSLAAAVYGVTKSWTCLRDWTTRTTTGKWFNLHPQPSSHYPHPRPHHTHMNKKNTNFSRLWPILSSPLGMFGPFSSSLEEKIKTKGTQVALFPLTLAIVSKSSQRMLWANPLGVGSNILKFHRVTFTSYNRWQLNYFFIPQIIPQMPSTTGLPSSTILFPLLILPCVFLL